MIGRSSQHSSLFFEQDMTLSRKHGRFSLEEDGQFYYYDLSSANGSWLKVVPNMPMRFEDGQIIKLGEAVQFKVHLGTASQL